MRTFLAVFIMLLAGCANPYAKFYRGVPDARLIPNYEMAQGDLQIYGTDNFDRDTRALMRRGYSPIGQATFNAPAHKVSESQLRQQAEKIGAHAVLVSSKHTNTVSGAMPLTIPQTTTSYSSGTATAYGAGGVVNAYGSGTTTTFGSQTMMMPYSIARSDFSALFFAKRKMRLGVYPRPVDDETRRRLQTNAGVSVLEVAEGSPAFAADILPGDVVLVIGTDSVQSVQHFSKLLDKYQGQTTVFSIDRDGKHIEKSIEILSFTNKVSQ